MGVDVRDEKQPIPTGHLKIALEGSRYLSGLGINAARTTNQVFMPIPSNKNHEKNDDSLKSDLRENARSSRDERTRRGVRRKIDPATCDIDYTRDEEEFFRAMQEYKESNHRPFPSLKETLEVLKGLGYSKATGNA